MTDFTIARKDRKAETELNTERRISMNHGVENIPLWKTSRYMIVFVHFFIFLVLYGQRVNLSFAIVCMVNHTAVNDVAESTTDSECGEVDSATSTGGKFEWDKDTQGLVLASFFYGYILTQLPGGWLQRKYGAKVTLGTSMMLGSLVSILSPASAKVHPYMLASLRIFHGILQGVVFPCYYGLLGVWAPPNERSRMLSYACAGMHMGNILTLSLSGIICSTIGWEWTFHFFGVLGFVVTIWFFYTVYDSPLEHPKICAAEKKLILHSLEGEVHKIEKKHHDVPWVKILSSRMPWVLSLTMFCSSWGFYTLLTNLPTFMYEVLKFDLQKNGLVSALPYFATWATLFLAASLADFLISRRPLKKIWVRRIWNTIGMIGPGVFLVVASQVDCSSAPLAVLFMIIGQSLSAFYPSGCNSTHMDVLPRYSGVIYALSNTFSCIPGMVAPLVIAKITANKCCHGHK